MFYMKYHVKCTNLKTPWSSCLIKNKIYFYILSMSKQYRIILLYATDNIIKTVLMNVESLSSFTHRWHCVHVVFYSSYTACSAGLFFHMCSVVCVRDRSSSLCLCGLQNLTLHQQNISVVQGFPELQIGGVRLIQYVHCFKLEHRGNRNNNNNKNTWKIKSRSNKYNGWKVCSSSVWTL